MVGYLDSSVLLRHILVGDTAIHHIQAMSRVVSSEFLEIECRRIIHRYRIEGYLGDEGFITAVERLEGILSAVSLLAFSPKVKKLAMGSFPVSVKTLDAVHLASALVFSEARPEEELLMFSFDTGMNRCAQALGFGVPLKS
ncbi:MAG: PIN domain-containing protein [Spirochaetia bacterium]